VRLPIPRGIIKKLAFKIGKTTFAQRVGLDLMAEFARSVDPDKSMPYPIRVIMVAQAFNESSKISLAGKTIKSAFRVLFHKDDVSKRNNAPEAAVPTGDAPAPP